MGGGVHGGRCDRFRQREQRSAAVDHAARFDGIGPITDRPKGTQFEPVVDCGNCALRNDAPTRRTEQLAPSS